MASRSSLVLKMARHPGLMAAAAFNLKEELCRVTGAGLTKVDGIDSNTALKVISEIGVQI